MAWTINADLENVKETMVACAGPLPPGALFRLVAMIVQAAQTARRNKRACRRLGRRAAMIGELLQRMRLQGSSPSEAMTTTMLPLPPEARRPLEELEDALRRAHGLVLSCQSSTAAHRLVMGGRQARQLREITQDIDSCLMLVPLVTHVIAQGTRQARPGDSGVACPTPCSEGSEEATVLFTNHSNTDGSDYARFNRGAAIGHGGVGCRELPKRFAIPKTPKASAFEDLKFLNSETEDRYISARSKDLPRRRKRKAPDGQDELNPWQETDDTLDEVTIGGDGGSISMAIATASDGVGPSSGSTAEIAEMLRELSLRVGQMEETSSRQLGAWTRACLLLLLVSFVLCFVSLFSHKSSGGACTQMQQGPDRKQ
ncbi:hypothetical protein ACP4OV_005882 [Aristida adscensionis]